MSKTTRTHQWSRNPGIPIFIEVFDEQGTPKPRGTSDQLLSDSEHATEGQHTRSARTVPSFNSSSASTATTLQSTSATLQVSEPEPSHQSGQPRRNRPPLQFFLDNQRPKETQNPHRWGLPPRPRPRFTPLPPPPPPKDSELLDKKSTSHPKLGLGIDHAPENMSSSPIRSPTAKGQERTSNMAQRFEERIWRYNSSRNAVKRWILEIISWTISAICMGAVIGVLFILKDQRVPKWPLGLTLNAFIAVFSRISSAALLLPTSEALGQLKWSWFQGDSKKMWDFEIFDNASRGPWGSILLLMRTKGRSIAALGAAVTLFALAMDPFFQQVVDFPVRWTLQGNGSIPKVTRFEPLQPILIQDGVQVAERDQDLGLIADKFFFGNGTQPILFGDAPRADIPLNCPTSNCTWPLYETLGICSACADVSQLLTFACLPSLLDWSSGVVPTKDGFNITDGVACGYFLNATSESPILMSGYSIDPNTSAVGEALLSRSMPLLSNPSKEPKYGGSINFKNIRNPIADFLIVAVKDSLSVYRNETPSAHECMLTWCVQTINSSYTWPRYQESVSNSVINTTSGSSPWVTSEVETEDGLETDMFYLQNISISGSSGGRNISGYGILNDTAYYTIQIFDDMFPSFTTIANFTAQPLLKYKVTAAQGAPPFRPLDFNPWLPPNNITSHMERLATAMTNVIRSRSSEVVSGQAFSNGTYVSVRWQWMSLPLALLVASGIFLIATVFKTSREQSHVGVWKTSALATLLYGLPDAMQKTLTSPGSNRTPRSKAKELRVKLLSKGWRVSGNLFDPVPPKSQQEMPPPGWI